jgi:hypothetical protein
MTPSDEARFRVDVESYRIAAGMSLLKLSLLSGIGRTALRVKLARPGKFSLDEFAIIASILNIPSDALELTR